MQAPPHFNLVARCFGLWQAGLACVAGGVFATVAAWAMVSPLQDGLLLIITCGVLAVVSLTSVLSLARLKPFSLRWDTQAWWLGDAHLWGREPVAGSLAVVVDVGSWMLLRFTPDASGSITLPHRIRWLPVQRLGHEGAWHALRTTVHGAVRRSASGERPAQPLPSSAE